MARARTAAIGLEVATRIAEGAAPPRDLSGFDTVLAADPFTGKALPVTSDQKTWTVYSVGPNKKDETNAWKEPSLGPLPDDISFRVPLGMPKGD